MRLAGEGAPGVGFLDGVLALGMLSMLTGLQQMVTGQCFQRMGVTLIGAVGVAVAAEVAFTKF